MTHLTEEARGLQPQPLAAAQELAEADPGAASLARYLHGKGGGFSVYRNTEVTYFPGGEAKFEELLRQLEKAEKYIFLEYFIIDEGLMWGKILEVLARKAAEGVDVRVMYDGTCEFTTLPRDYPSRLEKLGIQCRVFSPVQPFVSTHYNYRDHRKILVIDGRVGFTSGSRSLRSSSPCRPTPSRRRGSRPLTATARWTVSGWERWFISTCSTARSATSTS